MRLDLDPEHWWLTYNPYWPGQTESEKRGFVFTCITCCNQRVTFECGSRIEAEWHQMARHE